MLTPCFYNRISIPESLLQPLIPQYSTQTHYLLKYAKNALHMKYTFHCIILYITTFSHYHHLTYLF